MGPGGNNLGNQAQAPMGPGGQQQPVYIQNPDGSLSVMPAQPQQQPVYIQNPDGSLSMMQQPMQPGIQPQPMYEGGQTSQPMYVQQPIQPGPGQPMPNQTVIVQSPVSAQPQPVYEGGQPHGSVQTGYPVADQPVKESNSVNVD